MVHIVYTHIFQRSRGKMNEFCLAEDLEEGTKEFKKVAKEAKWKGCCNLCKSRCKTIAMIVGAIIVLTLALALVLLGEYVTNRQ